MPNSASETEIFSRSFTPLPQYNVKQSMWLKVRVYDFGHITWVRLLIKPASQKFLSYSCFEDQIWKILCKLLRNYYVYFLDDCGNVWCFKLIKINTYFYYYNSFNFRNKQLNQFYSLNSWGNNGSSHFHAGLSDNQEQAKRGKISQKCHIVHP